MEWPDAVYDKVGNILLSRIMGADVRLVESEFGIGFKESWEQALADVEARRRQALRDPGRRLRPPARRARLRALGAGGRCAGAGARRLLRPRDRLLGDRLDPGGDGRRLRRPGPAAPRDRDRRLGQAARDEGAGDADRAGDRGADRGRPRAAAPTSSSSTTATTPAPTASPTRRRSTRSAPPRDSRGCSPTRSTRGSRWPGRSTSCAAARSPKDANVLYAHLGGQPALNAYSGVF